MKMINNHSPLIVDLNFISKIHELWKVMKLTKKICDIYISITIISKFFFFFFNFKTDKRKKSISADVLLECHVIKRWAWSPWTILWPSHGSLMAVLPVPLSSQIPILTMSNDLFEYL